MPNTAEHGSERGAQRDIAGLVSAGAEQCLGPVQFRQERVIDDAGTTLERRPCHSSSMNHAIDGTKAIAGTGEHALKRRNIGDVCSFYEDLGA
jgi:hypothetical protein